MILMILEEISNTDGSSTLGSIGEMISVSFVFIAAGGAASVAVSVMVKLKIDHQCPRLSSKSLSQSSTAESARCRIVEAI